MDVPESVLPESVAVIADGVHLELSCAIRAGEPCVVLRAYSGAEHKSFSLAPGEAVRVEAIHSNGSISVHLRSSPLKSLVVDKRDRAAQLLRMLAAVGRLVAAVDTPVLRSRLDAALGMGRRASASRLVAGDPASPPSVVLPSLPPAELLQADPSAPLVIPERSPSDSGSAGSTCRASLRALLAVVPPALPAKGLRVATLDGWSKRWARLTLRQRAAAVVVADAACVDTWQGALGQRPAQAAHAWAQSMLKSSRAEEAAAAPKPADAPFAQQVSDAVTLLLGSSTGEAGSDRAPKSLMGSVAMGGVSESAGTERLDSAAAAAAADRGQCGSAEWWREALGPAACIVCVEPMRALPAAEAPAATG
ncbi:hypothetical protein FNF29_01190 [Cafeteria roenbergensis]|uniref:Uncharacterized protein n=1 Tax=Cafeteria roenbergensis TaxID=33653 RepID=A0A5A8CUG7_CAFRO|nr:hypothetical protein FNF29_01190 [Cafeteria roenbergensis]|eukprot:KAA0156398.1 hypothetical protein FNF29_01190 [Cafeteria roenbergensis]